MRSLKGRRVAAVFGQHSQCLNALDGDRIAHSIANRFGTSKHNQTSPHLCGLCGVPISAVSASLVLAAGERAFKSELP